MTTTAMAGKFLAVRWGHTPGRGSSAPPRLHSQRELGIAPPVPRVARVSPSPATQPGLNLAPCEQLAAWAFCSGRGLNGPGQLLLQIGATMGAIACGVHCKMSTFLPIPCQTSVRPAAYRLAWHSLALLPSSAHLAGRDAQQLTLSGWLQFSGVELCLLSPSCTSPTGWWVSPWLRVVPSARGNRCSPDVARAC